ncbi:hypothetical protein ABKN59_005084 [Abortiporus biennis]
MPVRIVSHSCILVFQEPSFLPPRLLHVLIFILSVISLCPDSRGDLPGLRGSVFLYQLWERFFRYPSISEFLYVHESTTPRSIAVLINFNFINYSLQVTGTELEDV